MDVGTMPLSKKRDRLRKREQARKKRPNRLSKQDVRAMRRAGIDVEEAVGQPITERVAAPVVNAIVRELEAKRARVQWQSDGIKTLQDEIATLKARMETMKAMDGNYQEQIASLSYAVADLQADTLAMSHDSLAPTDGA